MNSDLYVFLGDSLVFGYGVQKRNNWVTLLTEIGNINSINKGINGNTTTDMLNRFTEDVISKSPKTVFIMGGTNDLLSRRSLESIIQNLSLMIKDAQNNCIDVIIGIPPIIIPDDAFKLFSPSETYNYCLLSLKKLRISLMDLCMDYNIPYIDFYTLTEYNLKEDIFLDGIHLNNKGQQILAKEFFKLI